MALDGHLKEDDVNLASSTLVTEGKCPADAIGIVVSYSVRVKLHCGTLGGELVTDVPFKLLHPAEGIAFARLFYRLVLVVSIRLLFIHIFVAYYFRHS